MFGKKKTNDAASKLDDIIQTLQSDNNLYQFDMKVESSEYDFSICFPGIPSETEVNDKVVIFMYTAPDGVVYSVGVYSINSDDDKDLVANEIMDGILDTPAWHEYSDRQVVPMPGLIQTFQSNEGLYLLSTVIATDNLIYSINIQNVYFESASIKQDAFRDTFTILDNHKILPLLNKKEMLQQIHNQRLEIHNKNMTYANLMMSGPITGELAYLQYHHTKLDIRYFSSRFEDYLSCFLELYNMTELDEETSRIKINNIIKTHMYHMLTSLNGIDGVIIKSAFICALVSGNNNNIRSAYMKGKNSTKDKRFIAKYSDQEYINFISKEYPLFEEAISTIEHRRLHTMSVTIGYLLKD